MKVQREHRVPSSSYILLMENKHRKFVVILAIKMCKFILKCTKIRLATGLCTDPLGVVCLGICGYTSVPEDGRTCLKLFSAHQHKAHTLERYHIRSKRDKDYTRSKHRSFQALLAEIGRNLTVIQRSNSVVIQGDAQTP